MKKDKTFTWTTKKESKIEYILGCEYRAAYDEVIDDGWGGTISHESKIVFTTRVFANNSLLFKIDCGGDVLRDAATGYITMTDEDVTANGERYYVAGHRSDGQFCIITMPEDIYDSIAQTMSDFENNFADIVERKAKKLETEKAELIKFIEKAEGQKWLPTNAEYAAWRKNYNNVMNEGGEGYIPSCITREALENAKLKLEGLEEKV